MAHSKLNYDLRIGNAFKFQHKRLNNINFVGLFLGLEDDGFKFLINGHVCNARIHNMMGLNHVLLKAYNHDYSSTYKISKL